MRKYLAYQFVWAHVIFRAVQIKVGQACVNIGSKINVLSSWITCYFFTTQGYFSLAINDYI